MAGISLGIDLGTANVTICVPGQGVLLKEPSVIAVDSQTSRVIACGRQAHEMLGRAPTSISVVRPLTKGVINEYDFAQEMLRTFIRQVCAYKVIKPSAALSIPSSITDVEQSSAIQAVLAAGVRKVTLVEEAVATALGCDLDISAPYGSMVVNVGAGTTDVAVMSLRGITSSLTIELGGDNMDNAIIKHMQSVYGLLIGKMTAENIRIAIGNAYPNRESDKKLDVKGRDMATGLPTVKAVPINEIHEAISPQTNLILDTIQKVLENTSPELAGDIMDSGIVLAGGISSMNGLAQAISSFTGVKCKIADQPTDCVAIGTAKTLGFDEVTSGVYDISQFQFPVTDSADS